MLLIWTKKFEQRYIYCSERSSQDESLKIFHSRITKDMGIINIRNASETMIITARNEVGARLYFHRHLWFCPWGRGVSQHALQVVSQHALQQGCYPSMHCRWYPSMPCSRDVPAPGGVVCSGGCLVQGVTAPRGSAPRGSAPGGLPQWGLLGVRTILIKSLSIWGLCQTIKQHQLLYPSSSKKVIIEYRRSHAY